MKYEEHTFFDAVYDIFYKVAKHTPEDIGFIFSYEANYPLINFRPKLEIIMPLPKIQDENIIFEGMVFENSETGRKNLWCLFLASVYHLAAHAAVSKYSIYSKWFEKKTHDICWQIIDFIEDIAVEKHLSGYYPEIWKNIESINRLLIPSYDDEKIKQKNNSSKEKTVLSFIENDKKKLELIKHEICLKRTDPENKENMLSYADILYKTRELLPKNILPYVEHHKDEQLIKIEKKGIKFTGDGLFEENIILLNELWEINEKEKSQVLRRYSKALKGLNFDSIIIPLGNLHQYEEIKLKILPMLRKIRQQLRLMPNVEDDPKLDDIGLINMQYAIQAVASENTSMEIFDREVIRRAEEAWVILVDSSASMKLKFDKIKEFAMCVAEAASELTGKADAWAMYSFDNNFTILKDFKEKYNKEVKARIGALKNSGLSLLPDALELSSKILAQDTREKKYIFILTDGYPSGYEEIEKRYTKVVKVIEMSNISLIAIGLSKKKAHNFRNTVRGSDLKQLVSNFISTYKAASVDM
jgi:hypothetical protein